MRTTTAGPKPFRLGGRARKAFLVVHISSAALWFGVDVALGILVLTAMLTVDPVTAGVALQAVDLFAVWPMFGASLVCLGAGVVLGLGGKYGLVRYWWVAVKLAINVLMSILIYVALRPGIGEAAGLGERLLAGDPTAVVPDGLIYPVVVAPTLLLIAYVLSTVKPWGRTRRPPMPTAAGPARSGRSPIGVLS
ncbi:MAG: hypothetical protein L0K86_05995 [Actinomycetia bacterium]|nr:hypothetical protein [Actinomycetes bacterium]